MEWVGTWVVGKILGSCDRGHMDGLGGHAMSARRKSVWGEKYKLSGTPIKTYNGTENRENFSSLRVKKKTFP